MTELNKISSYHFELPSHLIADTPANPRQEARLLVVKSSPQTEQNNNAELPKLEHTKFSQLKNYLRPGDLLIVNDVRVQRARLFAYRKTGGRVEILLIGDITAQTRRIECMHRCRRQLQNGEILHIQNHPEIKLRFEKNNSTSNANTNDATTSNAVTFLGDEPITTVLSKIGELPLPPYILKRRLKQGKKHYIEQDNTDYQTVYANAGSAVAAPTAGLHFSHTQLAELTARGIELGRIRLDVGIGTFQPVRHENLDEHHMHEENYILSDTLARQIAAAQTQKRRIIAVGTTVVRAIEDNLQRHPSVTPGHFTTSIFIRPGFHFRAIDALITNFHLPDSTLIVLVSAFAGYEQTMRAYQLAIEKQYRFYSYGDAMLLFRK